MCIYVDIYMYIQSITLLMWGTSPLTHTTSCFIYVLTLCWIMRKAEVTTRYSIQINSGWSVNVEASSNSQTAPWACVFNSSVWWCWHSWSIRNWDRHDRMACLFHGSCDLCRVLEASGGSFTPDGIWAGMSEGWAQLGLSTKASIHGLLYAFSSQVPRGRVPGGNSRASFLWIYVHPTKGWEAGEHELTPFTLGPKSRWQSTVLAPEWVCLACVNELDSFADYWPLGVPPGINERGTVTLNID